MEEYHAVLIGNNYILISQDGQTIHTVPKMSFSHEIGDYNKVMVENKDGKFFVKQIQQNQPEGFTGVNIPRTCSTQQSLTEAGVQTAAIQAGGADAKTLFKKYKCIHTLIEGGNVEDIKKIQNVIFGTTMELAVYPLVQISDTTMLFLLFHANHDIMFLTSSDAITENAAILLDNPYVQLTIQTVDGIGKTADIPMPWINVTSRTKLYDVEYTMKMPLYILPIATDLKYPSTASSWLTATQNSIRQSAKAATTKFGVFGNTIGAAINEKINTPVAEALGKIQSRAIASATDAGNRFGTIFNEKVNTPVASAIGRIQEQAVGKLGKVFHKSPQVPRVAGGSLANAKVRKSRRAY